MKEMESFLSKYQGTPAQAKSVFRSIYRDGVLDASALKISKKVIDRVRNDMEIPQLQPNEVLPSGDGSKKMIFRQTEGTFEAVCIPIKDRITVCVSSQMGCALDCGFCITGTIPLKRNLLAWEMVEQIICAQRVSDRGKVSNVVFMGMGEPFYNYDEVKKCVEIIANHDGLGIGKSKITVSTAGIVPQITRWGEEVGTSLAVSIIAASEEKRSKLMSISKKYPLQEVVESIRRYTHATGKKVFCEYILMEGITDQPEDIDDLVAWFDEMNVTINLIPYNDNKVFPFRRPPREKVFEFRNKLLTRGLFCTIRWSYGGDIGAACGQLVD